MGEQMRKTDGKSWAAVLIISVLASIATVVPAAADDTQGELSATDAVVAVQEVASQSNTGPIEEAETFTVESDGSRVVADKETEVAIEAGNSPTITLESEIYEPLHVNGGLEGEVKVTSDGTSVYETKQNYSVVPLPYKDGSIQLINVLADSAAPERYEYDFSSTTPVSITLKDGVALILDVNGDFIGGVTAPWAYDAHGVAVPTHFEIAGSTLIQVVEHSSGSYTYPISADPYMGQKLFSSVTADTVEKDIRINLNPTKFGRGMPPWVMTGAGWSEAIAWPGPVPVGSLLRSKATLRQQFDCHAFGNAFAGTWNLERFRKNRTTVWSVGVAIHHCNWKTADKY